LALFCPFAVENLPTAQLAHTVVPLAAENLPVGQGSHCASEMVVAFACAKKPALHVFAPLHAVSPAASVYLPPAQPSQVEPVLYLPTRHAVQSEGAPEPAVEMAPGGQAVQATAAAASEYLLAGHEVQLPAPLAENLPAGQAAQAAALPALNLPSGQLVQLLLPVAAACLPLGQPLHVAAVLDVEPAPPYLPAAQAVPAHDACRTLVVYCPLAHAVHAPAPASENVPARHEMLHVAPALEVAPSGPARPAEHVAPWPCTSLLLLHVVPPLDFAPGLPNLPAAHNEPMHAWAEWEAAAAAYVPGGHKAQYLQRHWYLLLHEAEE
jgi:hypothetical protein